MDEQKEQQVPSSNGLGTGNNAETTGLLEKSISTAKRLEEATAKLKAENDRMEFLLSRQALGGQSSGATQPAPVKEETAQEYKNRVMRGNVK